MSTKKKMVLTLTILLNAAALLFGAIPEFVFMFVVISLIIIWKVD